MSEEGLVRVSVYLTRSNAIKLNTVKVITRKPVYVIINKVLENYSVEDLKRLLET